MPNQTENFQKQLRILREFGTDTPLGTDVIVEKDDGTKLKTKTRSIPWLLGDHTAVIMVDGIAGCYALERVVKVEGFDKP